MKAHCKVIMVNVNFVIVFGKITDFLNNCGS